MISINDTEGRITKRMRWIARIWSIPIIVTTLLLLIGYGWNLITIGQADPYAVPGTPFIEALPPILLMMGVLGLALAWRWEASGGTITLVFFVAAIIVLLVQRPATHDFYSAVIPYLIASIVAVPGILFLVCWWRSRSVQAG